MWGGLIFLAYLGAQGTHGEFRFITGTVDASIAEYFFAMGPAGEWIYSKFQLQYNRQKGPPFSFKVQTNMDRWVIWLEGSAEGSVAIQNVWQ